MLKSIMLYKPWGLEQSSYKVKFCDVSDIILQDFLFSFDKRRYSIGAVDKMSSNGMFS